jgi:hypothetical protein
MQRLHFLLGRLDHQFFADVIFDQTLLRFDFSLDAFDLIGQLGSEVLHAGTTAIPGSGSLVSFVRCDFGCAARLPLGLAPRSNGERQTRRLTGNRTTSSATG